VTFEQVSILGKKRRCRPGHFSVEINNLSTLWKSTTCLRSENTEHAPIIGRSSNRNGRVRWRACMPMLAVTDTFGSVTLTGAYRPRSPCLFTRSKPDIDLPRHTACCWNDYGTDNSNGESMDR
jgi:hypothetical protein